MLKGKWLSGSAAGGLEHLQQNSNLKCSSTFTSYLSNNKFRAGVEQNLIWDSGRHEHCSCQKLPRGKLSILNSITCLKLFTTYFSWDTFHHIKLPLLYFITFLNFLHLFLLLFMLCPIYLLVSCRLQFLLQNITLNLYFFSLPFPPSSDKPNLTSHSHTLHCRFWHCSL